MHMHIDWLFLLLVSRDVDIPTSYLGSEKSSLQGSSQSGSFSDARSSLGSFLL